MTQPPFVLITEDRHSRLWKRLVAHFEARLDTLRKQNDAMSSEHETARLRGQIAATKEFLALNNEPPEM